MTKEHLWYLTAVALLLGVIVLLLLGCAAPRPTAELRAFRAPVSESIRAGARRVMGPGWRPPRAEPEACNLRHLTDPPQLELFLRPSEAVRTIEGFYMTVRQVEQIIEWYDQVYGWTIDVAECVERLEKRR